MAEILQARSMDSMQAKRVNTCLYPLIQLGSIGFSDRLTQPCKDKPVGALHQRCCFGSLARGSDLLGHDELSLLVPCWELAGCALQHGLGF
jgi:hypothetical protein